MIGYILSGVSPESAADDERMTRLKSAGPWQYQLHQDGCLATWKTDRPTPRKSLGEERKTTDGLVYIGPRVLPKPKDLIRSAFAQNLNLNDVIVSHETGESIKILPAFMSPRQILEDNKVGDYSTVYGRAVRALLDRSRVNPNLRLNDCITEIAECCRLAILYIYRMTKELLQDVGWLNEDSLLTIWEATIQVPKEQLKHENGS
jgi:hypothetical protein